MYMAERKRESGKIWDYMDYFLIISVCVAAIMGIVAIYSAAYSKPEGAKLVTVQSVALVLGFGIMILLSLMDYEILGESIKYIYIGNVILLILVLFIGIGAESTGTKGWIDMGLVSFQPAEIVKIGFIITFAKHLEKIEEDINYVPTLLGLSMHMIVLVGLILLQPDFGTAMVFVFIFISMLFAARISYKYIFGGILSLVVILPLLWYFKDSFLGQYQINRILVFFNPYLDPLDSGYNVIQSVISVGSGQLFGKGYLQGSQNQLGYLPAKQTDFIFATIGEEWGFVGASLVVLMLVIIIWRCIYIARTTQNKFGSYICMGVAAMLAVHTFENIGMCMMMMPITGIPLPFFSYGGSSLLTNFMAIGLVNSVRIRRRGLTF